MTSAPFLFFGGSANATLFLAHPSSDKLPPFVPLSIYDEEKHICSIVAANGEQILELIIEREDGDKVIQQGEPETLQ